MYRPLEVAWPCQGGKQIPHLDRLPSLWKLNGMLKVKGVGSMLLQQLHFRHLTIGTILAMFSCQKLLADLTPFVCSLVDMVAWVQSTMASKCLVSGNPWPSIAEQYITASEVKVSAHVACTIRISWKCDLWILTNNMNKQDFAVNLATHLGEDDTVNLKGHVLTLH